MARDKLREDAQKGSFDQIESFGKAALAIGAGAALLYRGGGRSALSKGFSVSEDILRNAGKEISKRGTGKTTTKEIGQIYNKIFTGDDSIVRQAIKATNDPIKLRKDNPNNLIGMISETYNGIIRGQERVTREMFETGYAKVPTANKYIEELASNDPKKARSIEQFIHGVAGRGKDAKFVHDLQKEHGIEKDFGADKAKEMVEYVEARMRDKIQYGDFKLRHESTFSDALANALDPDNIARVTGGEGRGRGRGSFADRVLGDARVTVDDLLNSPDKFKGNLVSSIKGENGDKIESTIAEATDVLRKMKEKVADIHGIEKAEDFGKLYVDSTLRKDKSGEIFSFAPLARARETLMDRAGDMIVGQVAKTRNMVERANAPNFLFIAASGKKADPLLAGLTNVVEKNSPMPDQNFMRIYDKTYRFSEGSLTYVKELDNTFLTSAKDTRSKRLNQITGNVDYKEQDLKALRFLDIGQGGSPNIANIIKSKVGIRKSPKSTRNILKSFTENPHQLYSELQQMTESGVGEDSKQKLFDISDQITGLNKFYSRNAERLSNEAVEVLSERSGRSAGEYFSSLKKDDEELLSWLMQKSSSSISDTGSFLNGDLSSLMKNYMENPNRMRKQFSLRNDGNAGRRTSGFFDALRIEVGKEGFMKQSFEGSTTGSASYNAVNDLLKDTVMSKSSKDSARWLAEWSSLQHMGEVNTSFAKNKDLNRLVSDSKRVVEMFLVDPTSSTRDAEFFGDMKKNLEKMSKIGAGDFDESYGFFKENADMTKAIPSGEWVHIKKAISPLDVISDLNKGEKAKAFAKQFVAGRNDLENVTNATFFPYFAVSRIPEALSKIGLDFSPSSTSSVMELSKSIMLKRVAPVALGLTAFSYVNDMTDDITGTSLTGAFASGLANLDLGMRSVTDATGLTKFIKAEKELNPLLSYWTGDDYMSREEREEWYKDGYQEVRKAKWWNFGSLNELRGSSVQYYQPNYLRRAHSDWRDKSLYDNHREKWSRSLIPTPTAPLSPIRFLMNPYWLEDKHKEDRPYPMSAPLFSEETPWGVVLNPTVGRIIKPRVAMHEDRLDSKLVDVKSIIEARNLRQFERAKDKSKSHMVRFRDGAIENVDYTTLQAPTASERVLSFRTYNGEIQSAKGQESYEQSTGTMGIQSYIEDEGGGSLSGERGGQGAQGEVSGSVLGRGGLSIGGISFRDKMEIKAMGGDAVAQAISSIVGKKVSSPSYDIEAINEGIRARARVAGSRPKERGVVTPESIHRSSARYGKNILGNEEARADLRGLTSGDDFIGELAYTGRYISGIYGYGAHMAFTGSARTKLDDAGQMNSASRKLWESNIGGLGGGYAEIFRRFLPDRNHMVNRINPLMNTMPDWMPERFRFGDPYTALPKGEMRMPGKGFESLHQLHPDMYGEYGAFDRFKILADIAPGSKEYKTWRDIVSKTNQDPLLREEAKEIKDRVAEQSKKYDFANYRFIGRSVKRQNAVVEKTLNNNYFTVVGDDRVYRMAGISLGESEESKTPLADRLQSGMQISMAVDRNEFTGVSDDEYESTSAAVFIDGVSLNKSLLDQGLAERRKGDLSAAASEGVFSDFQRLRGHVYEAIAHLPLPFYSQKYFKIRDPLESYKHEMVYGTPYASWSKPIDSFLKPAFERSLMSNKEMAIGAGAFAINEIIKNTDLGPGLKKVAKGVTLMTNRGAFMGNYMGRVFGKGKPAALGMKIGAAAQVAGWAYTRRDQPIAGTAGMAALGGYIGNMIGDVGAGKGAAIGAIAGAVLTSGSSILDGKIDGTYIPKRTKKKWELQEYFDRLEYIKYSGMFEKSARKAKLLEGTDIKKVLAQYEKSRAENEKMRAELQEYKDIITNAYGRQDERTQTLSNDIDEQLALLNEKELLMSVGKHARSALTYRQAMESTNFGLKESATWANLLRSLPAHERDHFMEFAKEIDPKKQKEILKFVSPHQKRALQIAWGQKADKQESMSSYFNDKFLPKATWSGWRPNVDMKDIEIKTIENEGMMLSDFGYYDSQLREPGVINASNIDPDKDNTHGLIQIQSRLMGSLKGAGLFGVDVKIEPSIRPGISVVADVIRAETYSLKEKVEGFFRL